jgi:hypothetical protein
MGLDRAVARRPRKRLPQQNAGVRFMSEYKPIICIDFDGVIHSYENGWQDGEIYGTATPGFFVWAMKAKDHFELVVYSSRSKTPEGIAAMQEAIGRWAREDGCTDPENVVAWFDFSNVKPPAFLTIDDRAICFNGKWGALDPAELLQFRTWTERAPAGKSFTEDYNRMIGGISDFCNRYQVRKPELIFHPSMLDRMNMESNERILGTLIFMGIRVRFGTFEQADVLRPI